MALKEWHDHTIIVNRVVFHKIDEVYCSVAKKRERERERER